MATWSDLISYVRSKYVIADENDNMIKMVFETGDLRSQVVFIWRQTLANDEQWVQVESPFAALGSVDLNQVLGAVEHTVCGGLALASGHLTIRHALPLDNLNINEFERPLVLVTTTADKLEKGLLGSDRY